LIFQMILGTVTLCLIGGVALMGIRQAEGRIIDVGTMFGPLSQFKQYLFATLLYYAVLLASMIPAGGLLAILIPQWIGEGKSENAWLLGIGVILAILPMMYLSVAYTFTWSLIADRNLGAWQALETSRRAVTHKFFPVLGLLFLITVVNVLACIPMFIGLIWTLPWTVVVLGEAYLRIFGTENASV
jgi:uncharacterized membrane protein